MSRAAPRLGLGVTLGLACLLPAPAAALSRDGDLADLAATVADDQLTPTAERFKGSVFVFDQSVTPDTVAPSAQLSPVPSYQWFMSFRPRYYLRPDVSLRARMDLTVEWLNAAQTTYAHEPQFGDTWTDLAYNPPSFAGILPTLSLRAIWPTSKVSQGAGETVDLGPSVLLIHDFHAGAVGEFEAILSSYALYHFVRDSTGGAQSTFGCTTTEFDPVACSQNTGEANTQVSWTSYLGGSYQPLKKLTLNVGYSLLETWLYPTTGGLLSTQTGAPFTLPTSPNDTRQQISGWFLASIDYEVRDWLTLSAGYYALRPVLDPNSQYGNPFYAPGGASRISLTSTVNLDWAYSALTRR